MHAKPVQCTPSRHSVHDSLAQALALGFLAVLRCLRPQRQQLAVELQRPPAIARSINV